MQKTLTTLRIMARCGSFAGYYLTLLLFIPTIPLIVVLPFMIIVSPVIGFPSGFVGGMIGRGIGGRLGWFVGGVLCAYFALEFVGNLLSEGQWFEFDWFLVIFCLSGGGAASTIGYLGRRFPNKVPLYQWAEGSDLQQPGEVSTLAFKRTRTFYWSFGIVTMLILSPAAAAWFGRLRYPILISTSDSKAMESSILQVVPVGSAIGRVKTVMDANGFELSKSTSKQLQYEKTAGGWSGTDWFVDVNLGGGKVKSVEVSIQPDD